MATHACLARSLARSLSLSRSLILSLVPRGREKQGLRETEMDRGEEGEKERERARRGAPLVRLSSLSFFRSTGADGQTESPSRLLSSLGVRYYGITKSGRVAYIGSYVNIPPNQQPFASPLPSFPPILRTIGLFCAEIECVCDTLEVVR